MRSIKFGNSYLNMDRVEIIRQCSGNVIEVVMTDGKRIYGNQQDLDGLDIVEMVSSQEKDSIVQ